MEFNECLSELHAINVLITAYNKGLEWDGKKVDLMKVDEKLFKVRQELEKYRKLVIIS